MKEKIKSLFKNFSRSLTTYILLLLLIFILISLTSNLIKVRQAYEKIKKEETKVEDLKKENEQIKSELEMVKTDEFIETQLRDKLGLAKEGEIVVVLPDEEVLRKLAPEIREEKDSLPDPNWKRWLNLFL